MNILQAIRKRVRQAARDRGYDIHWISPEDRAELESYERYLSGQADWANSALDLSRLRELKKRYSQVQLPVVVHSVWRPRGGSETSPNVGWEGIDLRNFRSHGAFVFSYEGSQPLCARLRYYIIADAVRRKDFARLLDRLREDGAFGCRTFEYAGLGCVSRDLLDSVAEINFLHKHLKILDREHVSVLDIGAGYGRLAHRMLEAHPGITSYTCVDAVPESTFLCEFYLRYRNLFDRAHVIPLDHVQGALGTRDYDLALNIHSFSECTYGAIEWWLSKLSALNVPNLMIVPNHPTLFRSREVDGTRRDYRPLLHQLGYALVANEPLLDDPAAREMLGINDHMYLFVRR
jgi:hypothetical protein